MKRILKIGSILAIALLMLLPVCARAQMSLNNLQNCSAGGTVASITATQGNIISFGVKSSLSNNPLMITNPDQPTDKNPDGATFQNGTFTWNTGGSSPVVPGSYLAVFEGDNGTQAEQLVVLITINSSGSTPTTVTVTASVVNSAGGSVSPTSQTVSYGGTATFNVTINSGFTATVSEGTLSGTTWTITNVTSTHTATITFTQQQTNTFTVTASVVNPAGGSVSPASQTVNSGGTATFTVTINSGYTATVSEGTLSSSSVSVVSGTTWTITNVTSTHTATITFTQQSNMLTVTPQVTNPPGGSVSPTSQTVSYGGTAIFTVTINSGYTATVSQGTLSGNTWTISSIISSIYPTITFTQQSTSCTPPQNAQSLSIDTRYMNMSFSPGETVFSVSITGSQIRSITGQILGLSGGTDVLWTWIMPDCKVFKGNAMGTDNAVLLDIRSRNSFQPNINYDYVPTGNHTFKIKANAPSNVIIWFTTY